MTAFTMQTNDNDKLVVGPDGWDVGIALETYKGHVFVNKRMIFLTPSEALELADKLIEFAKTQQEKFGESK